MYLDEQFSKVKELFEELEGMKQLLKVKYFKYGWSLYYNKAALYSAWLFPFPGGLLLRHAGLTAPRSADILGNLRSYLGLSIEKV